MQTLRQTRPKRKTNRRRLTPAERAASERDALERGTRSAPNSNDMVVFLSLHAKGIPYGDIETFGPQQNVRTFKAWRALGRTVRRGEHGVHLTVWQPLDTKPESELTESDEKTLKRRRCRMANAVVFHVSQTDELESGGA